MIRIIVLMFARICPFPRVYLTGERCVEHSHSCTLRLDRLESVGCVYSNSEAGYSRAR